MDSQLKTIQPLPTSADESKAQTLPPPNSHRPTRSPSGHAPKEHPEPASNDWTIGLANIVKGTLLEIAEEERNLP